MLDWDKLRIFLKVAELESISHAAEELNTSQSAVSRTITWLEKTMKIKLFHRHPRGVKLTGAGEVLFKSAQNMQTQLEEAEYLINVEQNKIVGPLRVVSTIAFGAAWLTDAIKEFIDIHPQIEITLSLLDEQAGFDFGKCDVMISTYPATEDWLIQTQLLKMNYGIFATKSYLDIFGTPTKPEELSQHKLIAFGQSHLLGSGVNWLLNFGASASRPHKPVFRVNNIYGVYRACLSNMGIACFPKYLGIRFNDLVELFNENSYELPSNIVYFTYPEELKYLRRIKVFKDFLQEKVKKWQY